MLEVLSQCHVSCLRDSPCQTDKVGDHHVFQILWKETEYTVNFGAEKPVTAVPPGAFSKWYEGHSDNILEMRCL